MRPPPRLPFSVLPTKGSLFSGEAARPPCRRGLSTFLHRAPRPAIRKILHPKPLAIRLASTSQTTAGDARSIVTRLKNLLFGTTISLALVIGYAYITDTRASLHLFTPSLLKWIHEDPEDAHEAGNRWLKTLYGFGLHPRERGDDKNGDLSVEIFGHTLSSPIGTSAGIDKTASIPDVLFALGPSIVEVGGATPMPQDGNPKPRVFRLPSQKALINRYGLNSEGADHMAMVLRERVRAFAYAGGWGVDEEGEQDVLDGLAGVPAGSLTNGKLLAVQVAKNKFTPDDDIEAVKRDYVYCVEALAKYADILVVNVSSPNTPGLRGLQRVEPLTNILTGVVQAARKADRKIKPAVMVKVSPDEDSEDQVQGICDAVWESGVDGVIVANTTRRRPNTFPEGYTLPQREAIALVEQGGYSGPQLFARTVKLVGRYRKLLDEGLEQGRGSSPRVKEGEVSRASSETTSDISSQIEATKTRDIPNLKPSNPTTDSASKSQPLIRFPERHTTASPDPPNASSPPALSSSTHIDQLPSPTPSLPSSSPPPAPATPNRKVIIATGGITNGAQALEILEAGASVAQVYTALVYGGAGTITRMKREMREEMRRRQRNGDG